MVRKISSQLAINGSVVLSNWNSVTVISQNASLRQKAPFFLSPFPPGSSPRALSLVTSPSLPHDCRKLGRMGRFWHSSPLSLQSTQSHVSEFLLETSSTLGDNEDIMAVAGVILVIASTQKTRGYYRAQLHKSFCLQMNQMEMVWPINSWVS